MAARKPRKVYTETDTERTGTKRRTEMRSQPKKGYIDRTTRTTSSGTVISSVGDRITKIKVVDRTAANAARTRKATIKAAAPVRKKTITEAKKPSTPAKNTGGLAPALRTKNTGLAARYANADRLTAAAKTAGKKVPKRPSRMSPTPPKRKAR